MRFDLHTHETLVLIAGVLGLIEQEAARLLLQLDPNTALTGGFVSMVLGSIGVGLVRGIREGRNGNGSK